MVMEEERKNTAETVKDKAKRGGGGGGGGGDGSGSSGSGRCGGLGWWHFARPFVDGGSARLIGLYMGALFRANINNTKSKLTPPRYITRTLSSAVLFGTYENIKRAATHANDQKPLSCFQDVKCGLIAAAIEACVYFPAAKAENAARHTATSRAAAGFEKYKEVYRLFCRSVGTKGILGLWKTEDRILGWRTMFMTAMLVSYNQSFNYFKNSQFSTDFNAHMGATAVSGFIAPLVAYPHYEASRYRQSLKEQNMGRTNHNTGTLVLALEYIRQRGLSSFCSNIPKYVCCWAPNIMALLVNLYAVRQLKMDEDL